jgi:hypothetical protein
MCNDDRAIDFGSEDFRSRTIDGHAGAGPAMRCVCVCARHGRVLCYGGHDVSAGGRVVVAATCVRACVCIFVSGQCLGAGSSFVSA